ncbi:odorant receptor 131-2-like [Anabas testudineus]|uniref:G-protein coupled receptors family 1 profile domain-containing protein n=1 Tax=Anabas testudineus TaxID=64144 RepID=A0A3Q1HMV4_ANATE|nr:odorant receptor 131-2-like [Anabas testudineus]
MNLLNTSVNFTTPVYRDTLQTAALKNVITVVLCISINYVNGTLVHTIRNHQVFNSNPRYILYIHLVINDMILLIMFTLLQVLSYIVFTLDVSLCIVLQMVTIFVNLNNPLTLAIMAVECYIAICFPLRHTQICTVKKTYVVIGLIWALGALSIIPDLFVTLTTESIEFFNSRVFCLRENVFRAPYLTVKRDVSNTEFLVIVWFTLFYTYFRILFTAKAAAADAKKARNTVLLHGFQLLLCMLSYVFYIVLAGLTYFFPKDVLAICFAVAIFIQILSQLISPLIYGLQDKMLMKYLKRYICCTRNTKTQSQKRTAKT